MPSDARRRMPGNPAVIFSVAQGADGVWMVNEQGTTKSAITYFSTKWSAMKHAVRAAKTRPDCQIRVMDTDGQIETSRLYSGEAAPARPRAG